MNSDLHTKAREIAQFLRENCRANATNDGAVLLDYVNSCESRDKEAETLREALRVCVAAMNGCSARLRVVLGEQIHESKSRIKAPSALENIKAIANANSLATAALNPHTDQ